MPLAPDTVLISAGEASGDRYAALLVEELRRRWPQTHFFGCTGPKMRTAGVETIVKSESLAVVGLVEVVRHLPRIYGEFRKLVRAVDLKKPALAILTDSPDFHLRVAKKLAIRNVPVAYLIAPQVWAWRKGRLKTLRRLVRTLICIFPFEEKFFRDNGVRATFIGHPLVELARPTLTRQQFREKHGIPDDCLLVVLLPGSRQGEAIRHLAPLLEAVRLLKNEFRVRFVLLASPNTGAAFFKERIGSLAIQVIEGEAWDAMAHADLALAASGTVTTEAAILGTPMVIFYRVNRLSWLIGKMLVNIPFFSMVNLIAGKRIVAELIQGQMTGQALTREATALLGSQEARLKMRDELADVARKLRLEGSAGETAISRAADEVVKVWEDCVA